MWRFGDWENKENLVKDSKVANEVGEARVMMSCREVTKIQAVRSDRLH